MSALRKASFDYSKPIPVKAGIGLRSGHQAQLLKERPDIGWIEVHSENYFSAGGSQQRVLDGVRDLYPVSLHGVGLSIGSVDPLNQVHLNNLRDLIERTEPMLVSEHLSWGSVDQVYFNDLLPLPYTGEALQHMTMRIDQVQEFLGRQILIENVSSYIEYSCSEMQEPEFLVELAHQSGCGILLDINNVYVSSRNHGFDPFEYLAHIPADIVQEIHLAGHSVTSADGQEILIDTHNARVAEPVWELFRATCLHLDTVPTLIEWDADLPELDVLVDEARRADACREDARVLVA